MEIPTSSLFLFNDLCRLCCLRKDSFFPIFEDSENNLGAILKFVLPNINIFENDSKPQQICYECRSKLRMFNEFLLQCLESECKFDNCLKMADCSLPYEGVIYIDYDQILSNVSKISNSTNENIKIPTELIDKNIRKLPDHYDETKFIKLEAKDEEEEDDDDDDDDNCTDANSDASADETSEVDMKVPSENLISMNKRSSDTGALSLANDLESSSVKLNRIKTEPKENIEENSSFERIGVGQGGSRRKKVKCTVCGKVLGRQSSLNSHMTLHTGIRIHKCPHCDKSFAMRGDLNRHMHLHDGTFPCEICGQFFISKHRLDCHRQSHSGQKPFQCEVCGKLLASKQYLRLHMKGHSEVATRKSYYCISCPTVFKDSWSLREHFDKVHSTIPSEKYDCPVCDKSFKWRTNYNRHVKKHNAEAANVHPL